MPTSASCARRRRYRSRAGRGRASLEASLNAAPSPHSQHLRGGEELLATVPRLGAAPSTQVIPLTAPRAEAQIAGAVVLEALAEHHGTYDAAIIAVFADPGLHGSRRPHGFPIGDHALPASRAACRCKFVHVLAALFTVVVAPSSIPLDMEAPSKFPCLARSMHRGIQRGSPMASPSVGVPIAVQMTRMPRCQKRFFPIETPLAAATRPRTLPVAPVPTQGDDNRRDDHV